MKEENKADRTSSYEAFTKDKKAVLREKQAKLEALMEQHGNEMLYANKELVRVRFALKRIDQRQYGLCTNCGCLIETDLLEVVPESPFCIHCLKQIEAQ